MIIFSYCPHCRAEHELSDKLVGQSIICQSCEVEFVVKSGPPPVEEKTIAVESLFVPSSGSQRDEPTGGHPQGVRARTRLANGKHALVLPPPPIEQWSANKSKKKEEESEFCEFDHDSRDLRRFLEREEHADDYAWLLAVGLFFSTLLVFGFLAWFIYLITFRGAPGRLGALLSWGVA